MKQKIEELIRRFKKITRAYCKSLTTEEQQLRDRILKELE